MVGKLDIAKGFWRMVCTKRQEWNFTYVLPEYPDEPMEIVAPSALQMGWAELQRYICGVSETAPDVIATYVIKPTGLLPVHPIQLSSRVKIMGP